MSQLKTITKKVISYCEIPEDLTQSHWISENQPGCYVEYSLPKEAKTPESEGGGEDSKLSAWIRKTYPELAGDDFLIERDY